MNGRAGLLDTSVFIAREAGRPIRAVDLPEQTAVSVVTIAELHVGVHAAEDVAVRARRLGTLEAASTTEPLPVTVEVARRWAELRVRLGQQGRRANVNDLWIAAIALANDLDVVTQDGDFDAISAAGGPAVRRV